MTKTGNDENIDLESQEKSQADHLMSIGLWNHNLILLLNFEASAQIILWKSPDRITPSYFSAHGHFQSSVQIDSVVSDIK